MLIVAKTLRVGHLDKGEQAVGIDVAMRLETQAAHGRSSRAILPVISRQSSMARNMLVVQRQRQAKTVPADSVRFVGNVVEIYLLD